jgi:hypothetical protein
MSNTTEKIASEYRRMVKHLQAEASKSGIVREVDTANHKAKVQLTIHDKEQTVETLLNATPGSDLGVFIYPKVDSDVVVCDIDGDGIYTIIQYGKVDKVAVKIGSTEELVITSGNIVMNGGDNGGLVKVGALVDKLNRLEDKVNSIITKYDAHTHTDPASGITGVPSMLVASSITPNTSVEDLKNDHVKH